MNLSETRTTLMRYAKEQWRMLGSALMFFIIGAAFGPMVPALFKLLDSGFQEG